MHNYHIHTTTIRWHLPSGKWEVRFLDLCTNRFIFVITHFLEVHSREGLFWRVFVFFRVVVLEVFVENLPPRPFPRLTCHKTPTHFTPFCPKGSFSSFHTENAPAGCLHCHNPLPDPAQKTMTSCTPRGVFFLVYTNTIHSFISFVS